jgi:hypothetical protein
LDLIIKLLRDNRLVLSCIEVSTLLWVFKNPIIDGVLQNEIYVAESESFVAVPCLKVQIKLEPMEYFSP